MATRQPAYTAAATMTMTMASLAAASARRGATITNSSNKFLNVLMHVAFLTGTVTTPATGSLYVYASGNDASTFETGGSTDAAYTMRGSERLVGVETATANTTTYHVLGSIAAAYDGFMPRDWGPIFLNTNLGTLSSTEGNHTKHYTGLTETVA